MAYSATARNSATAANATGSTLTLTLTITVTSTVAGDVGVVGIRYNGGNGVGIPTRTWVPPSGWTLIEDTFGTAALASGTASFVNPNMAGGITSLAFTLTIVSSGGTLFTMVGVYGAWAGGGATAVTEGANSADTNTALTTMPTVTSSTAATTADLWVVALGASAVPGNPTGTGTWTSTNTVSNSGCCLRLTAQVGTAGSSATASGASVATGHQPYTSLIVGITVPVIASSFIPSVPKRVRLMVPPPRIHRVEPPWPEQDRVVPSMGKRARIVPRTSIRRIEPPWPQRNPPKGGRPTSTAKVLRGMLQAKGHRWEPPWPQRNPPPAPQVVSTNHVARGLRLFPGRRWEPPWPQRNPPYPVQGQRPQTRAAVIGRRSSQPQAPIEQGQPTRAQTRRVLAVAAFRPRPLNPVLPSESPPIAPKLAPRVTRGRLIVAAVRGPGRLVQVVPPPSTVPSTGYPELIFVDGHPALHVSGLWYTMLG